MKQIILIFFIPFSCLNTLSQSLSVPKKSMKEIKIHTLKKHMEILTSDSLEGRATGQSGGEKAATYIETYFRQIGLEPTYNGQYRQPFELWKTQWHDIQIIISSDTLSVSKDFAYMTGLAQNEELNKRVYYLGMINDSSFIPKEIDGQIAFVQLESLRNTLSVTSKLKKAGAWAVFAINPHDDNQFDNVNKRFVKFQKFSNIYEKKPTIRDTGKRFFVLNNSSANSLFGKDALDLPVTIDSLSELISCEIKLKMPCDTLPVEVYNVVGRITGKHEEGPALAITAHYDHVGRNADSSICRGADDNGSGSIALLELASTFKNIQERPEYTILFIAFTAEELGLWGSNSFMKNHGPEQFLANINIDMIGRHDTITKENYVYLLGVGRSHWLDSLSKAANKQTVRLSLDYHYDGTSFMSRSDHHHFYKNDIPVLSFFSGLHPDYHTPRDTMDKIDFPLFRRRLFMIFASAYLIAYDPDSEMKARNN